MEAKKKAPYTGSSTTTYYRKYGPSGAYTKSAKGSLPLTEFFAPVQSNLANVDLTNKDGIEKNDTERINISDDENNSDGDLNTDELTNLEDFDDVSSEEDSHGEFDLNTKNKLEKLKQILDSNTKNQTAYDYLRHLAVQRFFIYMQEDNLGMMEASAQAAQEIYQKGSYQATLIRKWGLIMIFYQNQCKGIIKKLNL